jgi:hypothetical protein
MLMMFLFGEALEIAPIDFARGASEWSCVSRESLEDINPFGASVSKATNCVSSAAIRGAVHTGLNSVASAHVMTLSKENFVNRLHVTLQGYLPKVVLSEVMSYITSQHSHLIENVQRGLTNLSEAWINFVLKAQDFVEKLVLGTKVTTTWKEVATDVWNNVQKFGVKKSVEGYWNHSKAHVQSSQVYQTATKAVSSVCSAMKKVSTWGTSWH